MFVALDRTFAAFARVSRPYIQETIEKSPPTLDEVNADLPAIRPFLRDTGRFFTALRPGVKALAETSPVIAESLHAGIPALNASPVLNNQLQPTAEALVDFQEAPGVFNGLELLTDTNQLLKPVALLHHPEPDHLQLLDASPSRISPTPRAKGNSNGHWLELHLLRVLRKGRTVRAPSLLRPANEAGDRKTTSTTTPTRRPPRQDRERSAKPAMRST